MLRLAALSSALLLATSTFASPVVETPDRPIIIVDRPVVIVDKPVVSVPLAKRINGNLRNIAEKDRARAAALFNRFAGTRTGNRKRTDSSIVAEALDTVQYVAEIGVGEPPQFFNLVIDTGSSNTWVNATRVFKPTRDAQNTGNAVEVTYGSGFFSGTEFIDTVTINRNLVIKGQSIGVANTSSGFEGVDGIIGIGPVDLTEDTVDNTDLVPTVTDNLFKQGVINRNLVAVSFAPILNDNDFNGELSFGEIDPFKFIGEITFVPITQTFPSSFFWGIDQSVSYAGNTILSQTAGIVDTGTTLILLATDAFEAYQSATGAVVDDVNTGLLQITPAQLRALKPLNFNIGGRTFSLTANAQLWPRKLNTEIGGLNGAIYLVTNDAGAPSGSGLDFINGMTFLERFYSVFDTQNQRVGLATTLFTNAETN